MATKITSPARKIAAAQVAKPLIWEIDSPPGS